MQWAYCGSYDRLLCRDAVVFTYGGELPEQVSWELIESSATPGLSGHQITGNGYSGSQRVLLPVGEYQIKAKHVAQKHASTQSQKDVQPSDGGWDGAFVTIVDYEDKSVYLQATDGPLQHCLLAYRVFLEGELFQARLLG